MDTSNNIFFRIRQMKFISKIFLHKTFLNFMYDIFSETKLTKFINNTKFINKKFIYVKSKLTKKLLNKLSK